MVKTYYLLILVLFIPFSKKLAQEYCLQFSKKNKKTVLIKEGRNISFVFADSEEWKKGKIIKITSDSIFLEQAVSKEDMLTIREDNYIITPYHLSSFRVMAYNNTTKAIGKSSVVVLLTAVAIFSGSDGMENSLINEKSDIKDKFFKKNVNFNKEWKAEIIVCN